MSQKIYIRLTKNNSNFNENTGMWKFELPREFTNSKHPNKQITIMNFMYYGRVDPPTENITVNLEYTTLHSPTLCDGNFNQDNYIATLCYTYNTVFKTYPIKSNPQFIEFYFKDVDDNIIKDFYVENFYNINTNFEQKFNIDLELLF